MPRTRERVAKTVACKLNLAEAKIDEAIAATSEFLAAMPTARMEAGIAASVGHDAVEAAAVALSGLVSARRGIVGVHQNLADIRDQLGLTVVAGGDLWKLPMSPLIEAVANDRAAA